MVILLSKAFLRSPVCDFQLKFAQCLAPGMFCLSLKLTKTKKGNVTMTYHRLTYIIGVAPITQYTHVRNKNSNTQGSSPNVVN